MRERLRVACYVTREVAGRTELLVFDHAHVAEAGTQVPAGGVEPGETLPAAARREVLEETGLAGLEFVKVLGVRDSVQHGVPGRPAVRRHTWFVHLRTTDPGTDRWRHVVRSGGEDDGMVFDCRFVSLLPPPIPLADAQGECLDALAASPGTVAQDRLDAAYRAWFDRDPRVRAACAYGSRPAGLGDGYSDVEYWVFVDDAALPACDRADWAGGVGEPRLIVCNEFGAWVAVHEGLLRAEVHVRAASDIAVLATWPHRGAPVEDMVVVDRDGQLRAELEALPELAPVPDDAAAVAELCGRFGNWWLLGWNVLARGELERAADGLSHVRRHLAWMIRRGEGATRRWLTPSRSAEQDLSATALAELARLRPSEDPAELRAAYAAGWRSGERVWAGLASAWGFPAPDALFADVRSQLDPPTAR